MLLPQQPLKSLNILLTRAHTHSELLKNSIDKYGGTYASLPLVDIVPLQSPETIAETIANLDKPSLIIITSRSAIEMISTILQNDVSIAAPHLWATLSPATGELLASYGIPSVIYCQTPPYNSEALVDLLQTQPGLPKSSLILCGKDGRTVIEDFLASTSKKIVSLPIYARKMPQIEAVTIEKIFKSSRVNVILLTCVTAVEHLVHLSNQNNLFIQKIPVLVVSKRIQQAAIAQGFETVVTCSAMTAQSIIEKLLAWFPQYIKEIATYG